MQTETSNILAKYREVAPLCDKEHVLLVQDKTDGQLYVKKHIRSYNPEIYDQLHRHPIANTPAILEVCKADALSHEGGTDIIVIEEYLSGVTLAEHMLENGVFSEKDTIRIGMALCRILMDLHGMKPAIIHRDIKPSNIMLMQDGSIRLLDFSASKPASVGTTRDTVLLGTAGFAAPEQYGFSSSTPQTDIYAVGVLLNTMLTGSLPWDKVASGRLAPILRRCLKLNPKDRYVSAKDLYRALKRAGHTVSEALLPGFRTMTPYKILLAIPCYVLLTVVSLCIDPAPNELPAEHNIARLSVFLLGFLPILFYCNYMNVQRWYPFMRSKKSSVRALGLILAPFFIAALVLAIATLLYILFV